MKEIKIYPLLVKRKSIVILSEKPVPKESLLSVFEAARWAPSAFNKQPWRFIFAQKEDSEIYTKLFNCLVDANKLWAQKAPVLGISIAEIISSYNGNANKYALHDVGLATGNLIVQAVSLGLQVHPMAGFDKEKAIEYLCIPKNFEPVAMFTISYPATNHEGFSKEIIERENSTRTRRSLKESVYYGKWQIEWI